MYEEELRRGVRGGGGGGGGEEEVVNKRSQHQKFLHLSFLAQVNF